MDSEKIYISRLYLNTRSRAVKRDLNNAHELHRTLMRAFPADGLDGKHGREAFNLLYRLEGDLYNSFELVEQSLNKVYYYPRVITQSTFRPDWSRLPRDYLVRNLKTLKNPLMKEYNVEDLIKIIEPGALFRFRLRANPTKKVGTSSKEERLSGKKVNGRRIPLKNGKELVEWINRKGAQYGFCIKKLKRTSSEPKLDANRQIANHKREMEGLFFIVNTFMDDDYMILASNTNVSKDSAYRFRIKGVMYEGILEVKNTDDFLKGLIKGIGPGKSYGFGLLSIYRLI